MNSVMIISTRLTWSLHALRKPTIEDYYPTFVEALAASIQQFTIYTTYVNTSTNYYPTTNSNTQYPSLKTRHRNHKKETFCRLKTHNWINCAMQTHYPSTTIINGAIDQIAIGTDVPYTREGVICCKTTIRVWRASTVSTRSVEPTHARTWR